mmetsp:Transcript_78627/g.168507  ORF Transcript_78627/g.168507 Transcript_78627/m.168507 type:complete len:375 (-) Transcript_78627:95-1219(-)
MLFRSRTVSCTKDAVAELEVDNFAAACVAIDKTSNGKDRFREVSGPIMSIDDFQFSPVVVWGVDERGFPALEQEIGVYICRVDSIQDPAVIKFEFQILNQRAGEHRTLPDPIFKPLRKLGQRGWCPSFNQAGSISGLSLATLLDESQGWLHDGALRVVCKLSVVTGFEKAESKFVTTNSQQELRNSFRALLESKRFADVTIKVGDEHIRAHSLILASRSPVFCAMFSTSMRETNEREVVIPDLDVGAVKELISFFYTGEINKDVMSNDESTLALLQAAHRYEAPAVVEKCTAALRSRFTNETASDRLELADMINCPAFKTQCLDFMRQHMHQVQETKSYERLVERRPALLRDIIAAMAGPAPKKRRTCPSTDGD